MTELLTKLRKVNVTALIFAVAMLSFALSIVLPISSIPSYFMPFPLTQDKDTHVLMFALLTLITKLCLTMSARRLIIVLVVMAIASEYAQALLPYRSCNFEDFQANLLGIAIGYAVIVSCTAIGFLINKYYVRNYR